MPSETARGGQAKRAQRSPFWVVLSVLCVAVGLGSSALGCAVSEADLHRWETTQEGPRRLRAVILHDKYPHSLRVQAAMSLIRMKPRKGQRVGIKELVENTLAKLSPEERSTLVADLVPQIIGELKREAPPAQAGQQAPPDPSVPYKDAAYMMLTFERQTQGTTIIADAALRKQLETALTDWAMADFERRLNDRAQMYGMEQLLRYIGSSSVVGVPRLMTKTAKSLSAMADLVAKLGDEATKEEAGKRLVEVADYLRSDQWRADHKAELEEANRRASMDPTEKQFEAQLQAYQDESLLRVLGSMQQVGGPSIVDYCLKLAGDAKEADKRRQAALAALERRIGRDDAAAITRLLEVVASNAPDVVLDQGFRRIRELPREKVIDRLYGLFETDKWKLRRAAGATALQMSTVTHLDEFMRQLGQKATKNFSLGEVMTYGAYVGDLKEGNVLDAVVAHRDKGAVQARLVAFAYYFSYGTKADIAALKPFEDDGEKIPKCDEGAECGWECEVAKEGDPKARDNKTITTIGEFVKYCVEPQMEQNQPRQDKEPKGSAPAPAPASASATPETPKP